MTPSRTSWQRPGLTLLEVLMAMAILLTSLSVLSQILTANVRQAQEVQRLSEAGMKAQSKMSEIVAGAVSMESVSQTPFEEDARYLWSLEAETPQVGGTGLPDTIANDFKLVTIRIHYELPSGDLQELMVMRQMVLAPSRRGSTLDGQTTATTDDTGTGSTTTGTTGTTTSGSGGTTTPAATTPSGGGTSTPSSGGSGATAQPTTTPSSGGSGSTGGRTTGTTGGRP